MAKMTQEEVFAAMGMNEGPTELDQQIALMELEEADAADEPVDMTPRERVEAFYGKSLADMYDDEQINEALAIMLED